ncbi:bifunctional nicotinamidase/pyrazinamidase [Phreatobacter sp. AB_2022a]|uniref:bifunctional nicotinamidase/pyrazinamidase n=1 Tax=Phreatobacter sp. AB_2022a TaxID=3003134 RepID=UPI000570786D|nr:bifunctional nicotinamidase/pyrazinamidase [Phreatobacter sp. AB_2022a]MCZ0737455.1 bifunctional nicotinamidase/pyrazinamidase [Phreatobacter sp. AB_2022a]CEJ15761.1 nicotinamidase/pyrazinamidase [bacterium YEK0313]
MDRPFAIDRRSLVAGAAVLVASSPGSSAQTQDRPMIDARTALIVVDVQNDFCPGGRLAVPRGDEVVAVVNAIGTRFANVVLTQDWHPAGHKSFASSHPGKKPFELVDMPYGPQVLWPDHCIWNSEGAAFHPALALPHAQTIVRKGYRPEVDSYSGFLEADRRTPTGLGGYLKERAITRAVVVGLATDFCVGWTAQDAAKAGLETFVVEEACRAIDLNGSLAKAWTDMAAAGVKRIKVADLPA